MSLYYYLDVTLKIESEETSISIYKFKQIILEGLRSLFGEVGTSIQVDILKYSEKEGRAILRCLAEFYVKVRSSLSLMGCFDKNRYCSFHVVKASASLLSLLSNSRNYIFV